MNQVSTRSTISPTLTDTTASVSRARVSGRVVVVGALVLGLGSVLPWATVNASILGTYSISGLRGGGLFTLAMAAVVAYIARHATSEPLTRRQYRGILAAALLAALIVVLNFGGVLRVAGESDTSFVQVTPAIGLFLAGGAALAIIIGVIRIRRSPGPIVGPQ